MKRKIILFALICIPLLYGIRIFLLVYEIQKSRKVILHSFEKEPIFYHQFNLNTNFFYNYSKISFLVFPLHLKLFHKIHSKFIERFYPDFLLKRLSVSNEYFQFYPGFQFLTCSKNIAIEKICNENFIKIETEIDKNLEKKIIKIIDKELKPLKHLGAQIASVIIIERKKDYNVLKAIVNNSIPPIDTFTNIRLAGSTLKPFLYAISFEKFGYHLDTIIEDIPKSFFDQDTHQIYLPRNHDNLFMGKITIREALANSRNIPAVETLSRIKVENFIRFFNDLGIEHYQKGGLSLALGTGGITQIQLTMLYSIFANQGFLKPLIFGYWQNQPIYLTTKHNFQLEKPETQRVFSLKTVIQINSILQDKEISQFSFGSRNHMNFIYPVMSKTGTSRKFRDSWIAGIVDNYIITVWVGKVKEEPMYGISGSKGSGRIFHQVVRLLKSNLSFFDKKEEDSFNHNYLKENQEENQKNECRILHPHNEQIFLLDESRLNYQKIFLKIKCNQNSYIIKISKDKKEIDSIKSNQNQLDFFIRNLSKGEYEIKILSKNEILLKTTKFYIE